MQTAQRPGPIAHERTPPGASRWTYAAVRYQQGRTTWWSPFAQRALGLPYPARGEPRRGTMHDRTFGDDVRIQDVDLLARLNSYFDHLDDRLEHGQGWLIFNSSR